MSLGWSTGSGSVLGTAHAVLRKNRQDAARSGSFAGSAFGVVSDGCGQGRGSELGALLTVGVVASSLARDLAADVPLDALPSRALAALVSALGDVAARIGDAAFASDHLLATVVAFAARADDAIVFAAGDGVVSIDGEVRVIEQDNRPAYPAYELGGRRVPLAVAQVSGARRIAVATDGFDRAAMVALIELPLRPDMSRHLFRLQHAGAFEDDGAIAIGARIEGAS
jgi:hypothetical protein